ncbi:MAG: STAS domain-containing protein [Candidatus Geothermincolia bacterium]
MRVPILKQQDFLIASVQVGLSDVEWQQLRDDLSLKVGHFNTFGVIVDISSLDVLDSYATRTLRSIAYITALRGAKTVVVGIQPDVAYSMVRLGLSLENIATALDLEDGLAILDAARKGGARPE